MLETRSRTVALRVHCRFGCRLGLHRSACRPLKNRLVFSEADCDSSILRMQTRGDVRELRVVEGGFRREREKPHSLNSDRKESSSWWLSAASQ